MLSILLESYCNAKLSTDIEWVKGLSILLESYCNRREDLTREEEVIAFNSPRVLLQQMAPARPGPHLFFLSILLESYCNWKTLAEGTAHDDAFQFS